LSGKRPAGIPEWTVSMAATLSHAFGNGFGSYLRGEYNYVSSTQLFENTPPELSTWGQNFVNASLGLTNEPHKYEVMIWARNLTNDDTMVATFPTVAQTGSYSGFPNQPRTYGVTFRKKW
jgi:iron complex outermembrane receptor protein